MDLKQRGELHERFGNVSDDAVIESLECTMETLNDLLYVLAERGLLVTLDWNEEDDEADVVASVYRKVL